MPTIRSGYLHHELGGRVRQQFKQWVDESIYHVGARDRRSVVRVSVTAAFQARRSTSSGSRGRLARPGPQSIAFGYRPEARSDGHQRARLRHGMAGAPIIGPGAATDVTTPGTCDVTHLGGATNVPRPISARIRLPLAEQVEGRRHRGHADAQVARKLTQRREPLTRLPSRPSRMPRSIPSASRP